MPQSSRSDVEQHEFLHRVRVATVQVRRPVDCRRGSRTLTEREATLVLAFLLGVAASLVASLLLATGVWYLRRRRLRHESGLGGVWLQLIYGSGDDRYEGVIERVDLVTERENLRRTRVTGCVYRIYDGRSEAGLQEYRRYKFRGHQSAGVECVHFWCVGGVGSNGTWLLVHNNRDQMAGQYSRRASRTEVTLPLETFPMRRLRPTSPTVEAVLKTGGVAVSRFRELPEWPAWAKQVFHLVRQLLAETAGKSRSGIAPSAPATNADDAGRPT